MLFGAITNRNMLPGVIQYGKRKSAIRKILFDFNHQKILANYDEKQLFYKFQENFEIKNCESPRNLWRQFAKSIISSCEFMNNFSSVDEFDSFINTFSKNELTRAALPMLLEKEIGGMGFALACDFLKELGYPDYPKPDVHLMDIFCGLGICKPNQYDVFKAIVSMARASERTAYYVDKTLWLICSGFFYKDNIRIPGRKAEFIELCAKNIVKQANKV